MDFINKSLDFIILATVAVGIVHFYLIFFKKKIECNHEFIESHKHMQGKLCAKCGYSTFFNRQVNKKTLDMVIHYIAWAEKLDGKYDEFLESTSSKYGLTKDQIKEIITKYKEIR